ncbi:MAG TPA: pyridoxal 5'-phosphate synthase glutaminase subunit PdxT [Acidimicrobiia bacterium]|nr:pyridoxal 5'-phosphate synthase glutaminase subunit PdxT [Acidimicrobiia bacterium]
MLSKHRQSRILLAVTPPVASCETIASKNTTRLTIGILALQGAYDLHADTLRDLSADSDLACEIDVRQVKKPGHLHDLDGIVIPGGESTVLQKLLTTSGLDDPLRDAIEAGLPVLGTCAGLIILSNHFGVIDCEVDRNSYGTQINSFEAEVDFLPTSKRCRAFFIRAPRIISVGKNAEVIAVHGEEIVGVAQGNILGITCHPEVAGVSIFHHFFVEKILRRVQSNE